MNTNTILLIEDDENLSRGISFTFEKEGFHVICAANIADGKKAFTEHTIDMIILDVGLPDGSGLDLCKWIRGKSKVPIIMLTANNLETDEVSGLLAGADDYVTKPFSLAVLRARVEALLRRTAAVPNVLVSGRFKLDTNQCKFYQEGKEIPISTTEYKLLYYFMTNGGQVLSKEQILTALWDSTGNFVDENILPVNISRIRAKIEENPKKPTTLKTVHGIGYIWNRG